MKNNDSMSSHDISESLESDYNSDNSADVVI